MFWRIVLILLLTISQRVITLICTRYPANTFTPKSPVDDNFGLSMSGSPQTYILGQGYNISVNAFNGQRFISFILALENENGDPNYNDNLGYFELSDTVESRFSPNCINMVESTNTNPKTRVDVVWVAPDQPGTGCVLIRATLLQHRDVWFMDDGGLTKRICEEVVDDVESQKIETTIQQKQCCACDEARYELTFEGTWSRNLHPTDFPAKGWTARFSDIMGASHVSNYRFWEYGALATDGMRELAEHGSPRELEREFNREFKNGNIRTIIKARGPSYPKLNGQSVASVRVDPQHHLLSLASKIDPSPDWIVGFSGLELCMANCTWLEQKVINLYPWDVGTDAGPTYTAADQPQIPPDVIRRMRSDFPSDSRSPFYDPTGAPMKPLAILTIKRQRLYERLCRDPQSNNIGISRECYTHPWTDWSECSAQCGEGRKFRTRVFKQPEIAKMYNCDHVIRREDSLCRMSNCRSEPEQTFNYNTNPEQTFAYNARPEQTFAYNARPEQTFAYNARPEQTFAYNAKPEQTFAYNAQPEQTFAYNAKPEQTFAYNAKPEQTFAYNARPEQTFAYNARPEQTFGAVDNEEERYGQAECELTPWSQWSQCNETCGQGVMTKERRYINPMAAIKCRTVRYEKLQDFKPCVGNYCLDKIDDSDGGDYDTERERVGYENNAKVVENEYIPYSQQVNNIEEPEEAVIGYSKCFVQLKKSTCYNLVVIKNAWSYDLCENECKLYGFDGCYPNVNTFDTFEQCELECKKSEYDNQLRIIQDRYCSRDVRFN